jgi:hypothetical protein
MNDIERLNRKWINVLLFIVSFFVAWEIGLYLMS